MASWVGFTAYCPPMLTYSKHSSLILNTGPKICTNLDFRQQGRATFQNMLNKLARNNQQTRKRHWIDSKEVQTKKWEASTVGGQRNGRKCWQVVGGGLVGIARAILPTMQTRATIAYQAEAGQGNSCSLGKPGLYLLEQNKRGKSLHTTHLVFMLHQRQELRVKGCIPLCTNVFRRENGKSLLLTYNTCGGFYVSWE